MLPPAASLLRPVARVREQELEQARRLGRWETEEDRRLVREHETRLVLAKAGRAGALGLLTVAWFVPLFWPFALVGSLRAFPRTTRRVGLAVVGSGAIGLVSLVLLVGQLTRPSLPPAGPSPSLPAAESLRSPG